MKNQRINKNIEEILEMTKKVKDNRCEKNINVLKKMYYKVGTMYDVAGNDYASGQFFSNAEILENKGIEVDLNNDLVPIGFY